ncbi:class I SAM-dependent methyltransferase [Nocardioides zeae]|uniref:Methyltransferase domain-containing protein n=1 Tax=Nocardioides zeae TaxID=1457234 RepID=A0A6P0HLC3_9ACTN|nr:methyltransferase domain-containing protein [Nocardioides zeae]MDQ1104386.1 SAM-dependent methyltransferase [Nocardioides zeae]NEN79396.1 methyltransferase domain-containing protein [Nocardioides zeae]
MSVLTQLRLFAERRLSFPVDDDALVLDVGSGDKPSWRADVLLDRYVDARFGGQRSGREEARVTRPLFEADAADMPFADGAFDYTICSNLLEHVPDPGAVIDELVRVSRAGYVEVPDAPSAKIVDFPSHVWWCRLEPAADGAPGTSGTPGTLVLTAKTTPHADPEVAAYLDRTGLRRGVEKVLDSQFESRVLMLHWRDRLDYRVEGEVDPALMAWALEQPGHPRTAVAGAIAAATDVVTWRRQRRMARRPIRFDDVVKPELRRGDGTLLERRVYRLGEPAAQ